MKHEKTAPPFTPRDVTHHFDGHVEELPSTIVDEEINKAQPREFAPMGADQASKATGGSDGVHGSFQGEAQS